LIKLGHIRSGINEGVINDIFIGGFIGYHRLVIAGQNQRGHIIVAIYGEVVSGELHTEGGAGG
jgi:hypothetical protein